MNSISKNNSDENPEERIVPMRLQKFLARAGIASRRGSENLMSAGRVRVNGEVVTELGSKVDPLVDRVTVDEIPVAYPQDAVTLMLNKPAGYITTMSDPQGRPCVASLVPLDIHPGLFPVGRLDFDTRGLLLFSTDGELGHQLMHPSHHVDKTYIAQVEGLFTLSQGEKLQHGIMLEDGMTAPAKVEILNASMQESELQITIHEGRKRQVRRMCEAVGHPVTSLKRVAIATVKLGSLSEGSWRYLDSEELAILRS